MQVKEILLPYPPRELHPNGRAHWGAKARHARKQRAEAILLAKQAGYDKMKWPTEGRLCVWITGYARDRRRRDADGLLSSIKWALDGIAETMGVDDSRFVPRPAISSETRKPPVVRIVVTEMPGVEK